MDKKLESLLKKIEKNPEQAEQDAQRRSAAAKRRKMIPLPLQILRVLATWPVYLVQLLFEAFRFVVVNVQHLGWVVMIFSTVLCAHVLNDISIFQEVGNIIMNFRESVEDVVYAAARTYDFNNFSFLLGALFMLVKFAFKFALAPALITQFMYLLVRELDRGVDLMGFHKTFQNIQQSIEQQLLYHYKKMGSEKLDCEGIREVGKDGKLHKPILPITGTVYCIDFSETFYKRILKHLVTIAFALRTKYKCRTFVDNVGCIYTVTTISRQEFDAVADREITMCIAALHRNDLVRNKVDLLTEVVATAFAARLLGLA